MRKRIYSFLFLLPFWFLGMTVLAQDSTAAKKVEMAENFRADGKIYVVVAVLVTILLGLLLYVIRLDRKILRFEKELK
jgi:hypothetical protein